MRICYFLTRNLYPYLLPAIMSLLDHNTPEKIYVFCEDDIFPYELPAMCQVINVTDQQYISHDSPNWHNHFTWMGLVRIALPKLLPDEDKIIQLDVDTIVCDSLLPIWNMDMGNNLMLAVDERLGSYRIWGHERYFNLGVAVLNLAKIREEHFDDKLIREMNTRKYLYIGQDIWNTIGYDRIGELPQRYNEFTATEEGTCPAIVHYAGTNTWWKQGIRRGEYYEKYRKFERN